MDRYLDKYKGKYRVFAHYDLRTQDFIRDEVTGELDDSFSDFYLKGKYIKDRGNIEIKHGAGSELGCYIPSSKTAGNVIRDYCERMLHKKYQSAEKAADELIKNGYMNDVDFLDGEVLFTFNAKYLDDLHEFIKLKTSGSNISPFSVKNLPRAPYKIPQTDIDKYNKSISKIPTREMVVRGKSRIIPDGLIIKTLNKQFDQIIINSMSKGFDIDKDRKTKCLRGKEYIHSIGMWDQYCKFMSEYKE